MHREPRFQEAGPLDRCRDRDVAFSHAGWPRYLHALPHLHAIDPRRERGQFGELRRAFRKFLEVRDLRDGHQIGEGNSVAGKKFLVACEASDFAKAMPDLGQRGTDRGLVGRAAEQRRENEGDAGPG